MRLLLALLIILTAIISLGLWTNKSLEDSTSDFVQDIDKIKGEIEKNNWDAAYEQTINLKSDWNKKANWWPTVLDHQEMDNIEFSLARVKEYVEAKDTALSRGQLSELKLMIQHIPEKEAVTIKNIL